MADSSESGGCFGSLASEPNNRSYRNEPEFSLSSWQCTSIACGKVVTAQPRAIINLAKPSVYLGVLGALQSHAFPQLHSLLSFMGQFLPLFLQPAGLSAAKETVHIIATRIEKRILL